MGGSRVYRVAGVILAGGRARRMQPAGDALPPGGKAFIEYEGRPLIERICDVLAEACGRVVIVTTAPQWYTHLPATVTTDRVPGQGPLGGVATALAECDEEAIVVVGCDMPFVAHGPIERMIALHTQADGIALTMPRHDGRLEPLHAVYGRACLAPAERMLEMGRCAVQALVEEATTQYVTPADLGIAPDAPSPFTNINTPADVEFLIPLTTRAQTA